MVFSDRDFLFSFLPAVLILGILLKGTRGFTPFLFLTSLGFYFWGAGYQVWILPISAAFNYVAGRLVGQTKDKWILGLLIAANLALLVSYKYSFFIATNIGFAADTASVAALKQIVLPIGISFFTFQAISYLVDVYRGDVEPEQDFFVFGAYLSFFPQLIAGPIVRFVDVKNDFHSPRASSDMFASGVRRFAHGLIKKLLIADTVAVVADAAFGLPNTEITFAIAGIGGIAYALQIYFDFSGYSDMAIGLGLMFGIRFHENFSHPYSAASITDFWRRWHISLSQWFRDYVYIPLGGNRSGPARTYFNLIVVFAATGLWHGANWTFLLWGLYHGFFLIVEKVALGASAASRTSIALRFCYCLPVVLVGWIIFRASDIAQAQAFLSALTTPFSEQAFKLPPSFLIDAGGWQLLLVVVAASAIFLAPRDFTFGQIIQQSPETLGWGLGRLSYLGGSLAVAFMLALAVRYSPFLYFRF